MEPELISYASVKKPFRFLNNLQMVCLVLLLLYVGKTLFIPLFMGLFIAIVLYPVCKKLEQKKVPKTVAIFLCLLLVGFLFFLLMWLFAFEIKSISKDFPALKIKVVASFDAFQQLLSDKYGIPVVSQTLWLKGFVNDVTGIAGSLIQGTLSLSLNTLFVAFMVPIFTALFLYNRGSFVIAAQAFLDKKYVPGFNKIVQLTVHTYHKYIRGMILVYLVVGLLNTAGLLLLGVHHALLFGMLTAVMTIIPYAGIIVSALLPISVAWLTSGNIWMPVGVIAVFSIVQYLEANVIFPFIVGAQINVSTWATLIAIIAGGILWGVAGMVLFMPLVAVLKIVSDHIPEWKPLNVLLSR
jgi:predicted PurR-regulated permease PerM